MIIDCISDLHGYYPKLEGGDLLIVGGDLTAKDTPEQHMDFCEWLDIQPYRKKIVIAGNHDNNIQADYINCLRKCDYLQDSQIEFEGVKIWGSPWTKKFIGMNPHCMAFTCYMEEELSDKWSMIPEDIDILITHSPPHGILDLIDKKELAGSVDLRNHVLGRINPSVHIFGHIHEWGGKSIDFLQTKCINASHVNERYEPVNKPMRVVL